MTENNEEQSWRSAVVADFKHHAKIIRDLQIGLAAMFIFSLIEGLTIIYLFKVIYDQD